MSQQFADSSLNMVLLKQCLQRQQRKGKKKRENQSKECVLANAKVCCDGQSITCGMLTSSVRWECKVIVQPLLFLVRYVSDSVAQPRPSQQQTTRILGDEHDSHKKHVYL